MARYQDIGIVAIVKRTDERKLAKARREELKREAEREEARLEQVDMMYNPARAYITPMPNAFQNPPTEWEHLFDR